MKKTNRREQPCVRPVALGEAPRIIARLVTRPMRLLFPLALTAALGLQCTLGTDDCRRERDDAALCALAALDAARLCTRDANANNQSSASCSTPIFGALLVCPLTISEACE